jgi:hypothetical protein
VCVLTAASNFLRPINYLRRRACVRNSAQKSLLSCRGICPSDLLRIRGITKRKLISWQSCLLLFLLFTLCVVGPFFLLQRCPLVTRRLPSGINTTSNSKADDCNNEPGRVVIATLNIMWPTVKNSDNKTKIHWKTTTTTVALSFMGDCQKSKWGVTQVYTRVQYTE